MPVLSTQAWRLSQQRLTEEEQIQLHKELETCIEVAGTIRNSVESYMTEKIAMQMKAHDLPVSRDIFEAAWNCIAQEDHIELLLDYCTILNASELKQYFAELKAPYSELSDRSRRHEVSLPINDKNKALAEHLKKIGYLTNWEEKTEKYFDVATNCEKIRKVLKLRVKQVR